MWAEKEIRGLPIAFLCGDREEANLVYTVEEEEKEMPLIGGGIS